MRKNLFLFLFPVLLAMVFPVMGFAQTRQLQQQVQPGPRLHLLLDAEWKFAFGNSADPAKDFLTAFRPAMRAVAVFCEAALIEVNHIGACFRDQHAGEHDRW